MELEYKDYYLKAISQHQHGLKLVLGGTGLGKTHGLREAVKAYLKSNPENKRKFIYITNRHNLITEQKRHFEASSIKCCYLKSNREIILGLIRDVGVDEFLKEFDSINFFKYDEALKNKFRRENLINRLVDGIVNKNALLKAEKQKKSSLVKTIEKDIEFECGELYKVFKNQLILIGRNDSEFYERIKSNKLIWKLFPYVEFENDPDANVLLVTIHKVLRGFFDGKKDIKIASIENKIIFLDEFDFLEQEIIKILCDEPSVINPLEFVRIFYEKFKHWSSAEFWESTDTLKGVRDKFNEVVKYLEEETKLRRLNFPDVIDFRLERKKDESIKPYLLFQTNEIITPRKFFLKEKNNSWIIQNEKTKESVSPFELFNILAIATSKILGVFHYYQKDQNLVSEIIQTIWNQKNDNTGGRYENYINENCLYHRTKKKTGKDFELYKDKSPYEIGFRLVKLAKRSNSFDPDSAELGQVELFTSPEAVIAKLSDSNLVFALSATTDIPRTLKCFNIGWLQENATYIPLDDRDYEIINTRRNLKAEQRQTSVSLSIAGQLSEEHPLGLICKSMFKNGYFDKANDLDNAGKPRYERVLRVFDTLYKSADGNKFSHLVFVTTFKELKDIIDYECNKNKLAFIDCNKSIFSAKRFYANNDRFFRVNLNGKDCSILLLNSEDARELQDNPEFLDLYKRCFNNAQKVIVITQYKSASNGINLPCFASFGDMESDFEGIHLLEQNHFWFDDSDEPSQFKNIEKQALWYLWKLMDSKQIFSSQFKLHLSTRDPKNPGKLDIRKINNLYKEKTDEKILNSIALFHQAIGRIERRNERVPEVDVTLDNQVFVDFYLFVSSEAFKELVENRSKITSSLIGKVHEAVLQQGKTLNLKLELGATQSFGDRNTHSREIINDLLVEIVKVRDGSYDNTVSNEVKTAWTKLREVLLKHELDTRVHLEFAGKTINVKRDFTFETKLVNKNNELKINVEKSRVYSDQPNGKPLFSWNLDSAYRVVSKNSILKAQFEKNGFKLAFETTPNVVNNVLTPYIYQAILMGAIGEYAISALLEYSGVNLEQFAELENALFEVVDSKVKDEAIFFDFKNYGINTLDKFSLSPKDVNYDPEINSEEFIENLKVKYKLLKSHYENPILYVLNLYSNQKRNPDYFDSNFKRKQYEGESCIRIIPSVLNPANPNEYSPEFESSLKLISLRETEKV